MTPKARYWLIAVSWWVGIRRFRDRRSSVMEEIVVLTH